MDSVESILRRELNSVNIPEGIAKCGAEEIKKSCHIFINTFFQEDFFKNILNFFFESTVAKTPLNVAFAQYSG